MLKEKESCQTSDASSPWLLSMFLNLIRRKKKRLNVPSVVAPIIRARISHQRVPNGGWEFLVGSTRIAGGTFNDLVRSVLDHQKANNLPISTVEDIEYEIAKNHPELIVNGQL